MQAVPYYWPSVRIRAKAVATNAPPHGAFRGFGAPQSLFAMERHMDRIAQVVGIIAGRGSPAEFPEARPDHHYRANRKRTNRSRQTSRTRA